MGADLLLNVRSLLDETSDQWWYAHTLIYSASRVLPLFVRAEQSDQFRTLAHLLGGGNKQELEQRFLGRLEKQTKVRKIVCFVLRGAGLFKDAYEPRSVGHNQLIKAKHSAKTSAGIVDDLAKRRLPPTRIDGDGFEIRSNNPAFSIASFSEPRQAFNPCCGNPPSGQRRVGHAKVHAGAEFS
jgi:hypothetical protein